MAAIEHAADASSHADWHTKSEEPIDRLLHGRPERQRRDSHSFGFLLRRWLTQAEQCAATGWRSAPAAEHGLDAFIIAAGNLGGGTRRVPNSDERPRRPQVHRYQREPEVVPPDAKPDQSVVTFQ